MDLNYDSSNRFLGMLAEVATHTLNNEEKINFNDSNNMKEKKLNKKILNFSQINGLSDKVLVDSFSEFSSDEIRRVYSFKCLLIPLKCQVIFESFATEDRARILMRDHLLNHVKSIGFNFTAETVSARNKRLNEVNKNSRKSLNIKNSLVCDQNNFNYSKNIKLTKINLPTDDTISFDNSLNDNNFNITKDNDSGKCEQMNNNYESVDKCLLNNKKKCLTTNRDHYIDHCYTNTTGPKYETKKLKISKEFSIDSNKKCPNISTVIATPAFPFVYEPVLPNISQVVEIGSSLKRENSNNNNNKLKCELIVPDINCSNDESINSVQLKRLAMEYIDEISAKNREQNSYSCRICSDKTFSSPTNLIYHYRSHAGVKPYECSLCKATFTRQHSLNYHMLIHFNKTRFVCEECGRNFRHPSHFKEHMRRHTGETPFECNECFLKFKTRNTYKRHLNTKHGKLLTSKGIFDSPDSDIHLRKPCPPRRKYHLGFLHQNIEAVARYENQCNQVIKINQESVSNQNQSLVNQIESSKRNFEKLLEAVAIADVDNNYALQ